MMKPKQYLRSIGIDIPENQRGRMSKANVALIKEAVAKGIAIEGYSVAKPSRTAPSESPEVETKVERIAATATAIADIGDPTYPESEWRAITPEGVEVGMRTVCNTCGNSLTYHWCDRPEVNTLTGKTVVSFKGRSKPLPTKRWY